jgi:molybdate/tungstate transport system substrate-binding protein
VVCQHGLAFIPLPPELNLGDPGHAEDYARVSIVLDFQRFASVEPVFRGEQIAYGLTIPSNALHPVQAARFCAFLLGPEGRQIMAEHAHPLLQPATVDRPANLPEALVPLCAAQ